MFRKVLTASVLGVFLTGTLLTASASAVTISNGVKCPTPNKTTKVQGYVYKCTKNPAWKNAKYTWVSMDCLNTNKIYLKANVAYKSLAAALPATLAALDAKIAAELVKAQEANAKADLLVAEVATWQAKLATFQAARDALAADGKSSPKRTEALVTYGRAILALSSAIRADNAAITSLRKVGSSVTVMQATRAATISSLKQAKAGVAQSLRMRTLICQKGL